MQLLACGVVMSSSWIAYAIRLAHGGCAVDTICSSCADSAFLSTWAQAATAVALTRNRVAISSSTSAEAKRPSGPRGVMSVKGDS